MQWVSVSWTFRLFHPVCSVTTQRIHPEDCGAKSPEKQLFGKLLWSDICWSQKILLNGIWFSFPAWNVADLSAPHWITVCFFFWGTAWYLTEAAGLQCMHLIMQEEWEIKLHLSSHFTTEEKSIALKSMDVYVRQNPVWDPLLQIVSSETMAHFLICCITVTSLIRLYWVVKWNNAY